LVVVATVFTIVRLAVFVRTAAPKNEGPSTPEIVTGATLPLPNLDWDSSRRHIVLALSSSCPVSRRSVGLYREIADRVHEDNNWDVTVIGDSRDVKLKDWLRSERLSVDRLMPVEDLSAAGIIVTPTLLLLEGEGKVTDVISGLLHASVEEQLWRRLDDPVGTPGLRDSFAPPIISIADLQPAGRGISVQLLDFRSRDEFSRGHRPGAINVPSSEMARVSVAFDAREPLIIDCLDSIVPICRALASGLRQQGFKTVKILAKR